MHPFSLMNYFELILTLLVIFSGLIYLADVLYFAKKRTANHITKVPLVIEYSRSFFGVLLLVLILRSFLFEPFRIPSGSLKPTLKVGDFILVNKFYYGLRLPVLHTKFFAYHEPKIGDIVVFRSVTDPNNMDLIKRIVAVPGDRISYINKVLYVNGKPAEQTFIKQTQDQDEANIHTWVVMEKNENLNGIQHHIWERPDVNESGDFQNIVVPKDSYFGMGDNRDNSTDSRFWGFIPEANIIGKAQLILLSWDGDTDSFRWDRIGKSIV